jgi:CubicO group peptidase (beta-lactamase class C family)
MVLRMGKQLRPLFLALSTAFLLLSNVRRVAAQPTVDLNAIDRFINAQMAAQRLPGLALAITQGNEVLYLKGYGTARANQPVTPQTQFYTASLSKSFTALAVMQLVEAGQIDLDAPIQNYLSNFSLADATLTTQITVRHLLNHTSGIADTGFPEMRLPQPATLVERVANMQRAQPVAPPGTEFHYSNANYGVLARLVEVVSGQPFSAYLHEHIFVPLQMTNTVNLITATEAEQRASNLAQGHLIAFGFPIAAAEESGILGGSGGIISTAEDMAHYLIMQNNGGRFQAATLLSSLGITLMHMPPTNVDSHYAMGWTTNNVNGVPLLEHNGILSTFYSDMVLLPATGIGIVLLYNVHAVETDALTAPTIKNGVIALLSNQAPAPQSFTVPSLGLIFGLLTLLSAGLEIRGLWRLARWQAWARSAPRLLSLLTIGWAFVPALLLLALPALVTRTSDRAFGYLTIFRSMLDVSIWLGLCAFLGAINGIARLLFWVPLSHDPITHRAQR